MVAADQLIQAVISDILHILKNLSEATGLSFRISMCQIVPLLAKNDVFTDKIKIACFQQIIKSGTGERKKSGTAIFLSHSMSAIWLISDWLIRD